MLIATDRLDHYWADELGCEVGCLYSGEVTLCAPPHREGPRWMGWMVPLECIVPEHASPGTGIISVCPSLAPSLTQFLTQDAPLTNYLPPRGAGLMPFIREHLPHAYPKVHQILYCDESTFLPTAEVLPITPLDPDDLHADWFRLHFDGPIYVARNEVGSICSWAAIKCKSDDVWEMAVVTEAAYRGRGLAKSVVSRATQTALEAGKQPLYLHEMSNYGSAKVCRALGYRFYGYELTCESGRITPKRQ